MFFFGGEVEKVKLKVAWANIQVSFLLGAPSESDLSFPAFRMAWVKSFLIPQESVQTVTASEGAPTKLRSFLTFQGFTITDGLQYHYKRFGIFKIILKTYDLFLILYCSMLGYSYSKSDI